MSKSKVADDLREIADDLEAMYSILVGASICNDAGSLLRAASSCRNGDRGTWQYDLSLVFESLPGRHAIPNSLDMLSLQMMVDVCGSIGEPEILRDPFDDLTFELLVLGSPVASTRAEPSQSNDTPIRYHCSWHLDRHVDSSGGATAGSESDENDPEEVHPRYHFHFGGRKMRQGRYGEAIILDAPRLAHPPLEAILGIDFVLANFRGSDWRSLVLNSAQYHDVVRRAQRRFWHPYLSTLSSWWAPDLPPREAWAADDVWPCLRPSDREMARRER